jgi:hypothetical protein
MHPRPTPNMFEILNEEKKLYIISNRGSIVPKLNKPILSCSSNTNTSFKEIYNDKINIYGNIYSPKKSKFALTLFLKEYAINATINDIIIDFDPAIYNPINNNNTNNNLILLPLECVHNNSVINIMNDAKS